MGGQIVVDSEPGAGRHVPLVAAPREAAAAVSSRDLDVARPTCPRRRRQPTVRAFMRSSPRARRALRAPRTDRTRWRSSATPSARAASPTTPCCSIGKCRSGRRRGRVQPSVPSRRSPRSDGLADLDPANARRRAPERAGERHRDPPPKPVRSERLESCLTGSSRRTTDAPEGPTTASGAETNPRAITSWRGGRSHRSEGDRALARSGRITSTSPGRPRGGRCLHARVYDLVLMDCALPSSSGFGATRARFAAADRRCGGCRSSPLTASTAAGARERCLCGMTDHLQAIRPWSSTRSFANGSPDRPSRRRRRRRRSTMFDCSALLDRVEGDRVHPRAHERPPPRRPALPEDLRRAITKRMRRPWSIAHAIRGSVSNLGGGAASAVAQRLELNAHAHDSPTRRTTAHPARSRADPPARRAHGASAAIARRVLILAAYLRVFPLG